jgi:hypothetical protein
LPQVEENKSTLWNQEEEGLMRSQSCWPRRHPQAKLVIVLLMPEGIHPQIYSEHHNLSQYSQDGYTYQMILVVHQEILFLIVTCLKLCVSQDYSSLVEHLLSLCKALGSIQQKKKKKKKKGREKEIVCLYITEH